MKVNELIKKCSLKVKAGKNSLDNEITGGYASDLLSDVLANSKEGNIWITLQIHHNIIAIASMKALSGIILINNREPEKDTIQKANKENIPILQTNLPAFELIGKLYSMGITGINNAKGV